jgi:hypothetical protein
MEEPLSRTMPHDPLGERLGVVVPRWPVDPPRVDLARMRACTALLGDVTRCTRSSDQEQARAALHRTEVPMTRARRPIQFLPLAFALSSGCDENAGVEEVDRGAKPIEAHRADDEPLALSPVGIDGAHVDLDTVHVVATGTVDDTPVAVLASEDGTPLCAVVREGDATRWVDVDALAEGRLERLEARPSGVDPDAAAMLLQLVAVR